MASYKNLHIFLFISCNVFTNLMLQLTTFGRQILSTQTISDIRIQDKVQQGVNLKVLSRNGFSASTVNSYHGKAWPSLYALTSCACCK
jgi:hypothetical protein